MENTRVVVTGMGMVCPLGLDTATAWQGLIAGKSGIGPITHFDTTGYETKIAGEVKGFEPTDFISKKDVRRMDRFAQLAVAASLQALKDSGVQINADNENRIGIVIGSGIGGLTTLFEQIKIHVEKGPDRVSPFLIPMMISDIAAAHVSIILGVKGPNLCTTSACSSGSDGIGVAYEIIKRGDADIMVTGGAEAIINPIGIASFNALHAISTRNNEPEKASRPFDAQRDGFVIGEGSGIIVLESLSHALKRGANIRAEIIGYGASADAYHVTQPLENGEGASKSMIMALRKAGLKPESIDYINAHGTATQLNDKMETKAIKTVFGDYAYRVPISSTKSMLGHLIGGAGAVEAAICILVIENGIMPPTINLTNPDPDCDLDYIPNVARKGKVDIALSNSFGFGGHNSTLIFQRYEA